MKTTHQIVPGDARELVDLPDGSIGLVVTSPPYPMIAMWDRVFTEISRQAGKALKNGDGPMAFEAMHRELDRVWEALHRVLRPGGIVCINVGDATRTIGGRFALYPNHARILSACLAFGFSSLPAILWRKQTNAPNKFMGSGMLPPGAYVTLEHEYILILRKGDKREFKTKAAIKRRRESAFFWEERNHWFSDVWFDLKGVPQNLMAEDGRDRSAAFPFALPYRLISMFSVKGDTVLDPFLGTGTTMLAAMAAGRSSVGYEIDSRLIDVAVPDPHKVLPFFNACIADRLGRHKAFIEERCREKGPCKYTNHHYGFAVVTRQETDLLLNGVTDLERVSGTWFKASYRSSPQSEWLSAKKAWELGKTARQKKLF